MIDEIGADRHFAWQQSLGPNVRFGSLADIEAPPSDVRFTPRSGHWNSVSKCPLCGDKGRERIGDSDPTEGDLDEAFSALAGLGATPIKADI